MRTLARVLAQVLLLGLLLAPAAFADTPTIDPFGPMSGRVLAMGGRHAALADDLDTLLANPAGLATVPREILISGLSVTLSGPVFDIANEVLGGSNPTTALTDIITKNNYSLFTGLNVAGPLAFGYAGGGLGFGLYNTTRTSINAASISAVGLDVAEDFLLVGGYAFSLDLGGGNRLDLGVNAKGYVRGEVNVSESLFQVESLLSNPTSIFSSLPFDQTTGVGVDLGARWSPDSTFALGLAWRDAYSPGLEATYTSADNFLSNGASPTKSYVVVTPNLDFGLMWKPHLGRLGQVIDSLILTLDYSDILDLFNPIPRNAILNVGMGAEVKVLEIVFLRLGIYDALPSAGAGFELGIFTLDITAYGEELGIEPGERPIYNLLISFEFRY